MKTYRDFITEAATAKAKSKKNFKKKWNKLLDSPAWQKAPDNVAQWHLTGHNADARHGSTKEVEKTKEKIFGKRKGNSHLFWIHSHHGLITHPAHGDIVHNDVELSPRKGIKVDKNIRKKVKDTSGLIVGLGRIEHHEGGGGMISYGHIGGSTRSAAVRTIARAYPKHKIHDGHGNELHENQIQEAYISKAKDGWIHSRGLGHRRWVKGNHSIEKQGKRGWTVYDWHSSKELHVAKTAKEAKAWSNANRPSHSKMEPIEIKPWTA
jgi:hypothetical protein